MKVIFADVIEGTSFTHRYNRAVYEYLGMPRKVNCSGKSYHIFHRDLFMCIPRHFEPNEIQDLLIVAMSPVVASGVIYGASGIILPHVEHTVNYEYHYGSRSEIPEEYMMDKTFEYMVAWQEFVDKMLKVNSSRVRLLAYFKNQGELIKEKLGIVYHHVRGFVDSVEAPADVSVKWDVIVNYVYWKNYGTRFLERILRNLSGLEVAVHDYTDTQSVARVCRKYGVEYYGNLDRDAYLRLYASSKMTYIATHAENFGSRFYEIGQLTYVASSIRHWDDIFTKVAPEDLKDFVKSIGEHERKEFIGRVKERIKDLTYEKFLTDLKNVPRPQGDRLWW